MIFFYSIYYYAIKLFSLFFILTLLLYCLVFIFWWLAHRFDFFGRYYAILFYALPNMFNITYLLQPMKNPTNRRRTVFRLINRYDPFMYWMMSSDSHRIKAYEEAIMQFQKQQRKAVWLDIGTGAHMTLTRLLLKHKAAKHVHAVEANHSAFRFARTFLKQLPDDDKNRVTLHEGYSKQVNWSVQDPQPNAIIHEIVGCIATDEGCIKVMYDTIKNLHGNVISCIPYRIGTLCVPASRPKISIHSLLCSFLICSSTNIIKNIGLQGIFNPPQHSFLCVKSQLIESFILLDYAKKAPERCIKSQATFVVEKNMTKWNGFYLAPYILTSNVDQEDAAEINGFKYMTNWPVRYVQIYEHDNGIDVVKGDEIHVIFESDLTNECPIYRLEAWLNEDYLQRSSFSWKGPAIS